MGCRLVLKHFGQPNLIRSAWIMSKHQKLLYTLGKDRLTEHEGQDMCVNPKLFSELLKVRKTEPHVWFSQTCQIHLED